MTKAKISEYSATAGDNTDVNGTNIAEGCPPSGINDAIREVMAALKRFETGADGDSVTVGGNLVVSGSTTANTLSTNLITEKTSASGVTIDGVLLKDNGVVTGAGTVSAPVYSTTGDLNTGIFFPAADTIAFAEGGAEAMRIDSDGDVGIGTSSPNLTSFQKAVTLGDGTGTANRYAYEINGGQSNADSSIGDFNVYNKGSLVSRMLTVRGSADNSGVLTFYTSNAGTSAERMRIDSSGNVGIGTTSPDDELEIYASNSTPRLRFTGASSVASGVQIGLVDSTNGVLTNTENGYLIFGTNNTERARITSGGYFKASETGAYNSNTGTYHEFIQHANNTDVFIRAVNASFSSSVVTIRADRAATSAYNLLQLDSSSGADVEFNLRGDGNGYADGTWNNNGADYAEFFESANGQALTLGATVVLNGNKVREATEQDPASAIIGVVRPKEPSKASMVVGNTAWNKWANKYLTDDFDRYIMEDHDVLEWEETITDEEGKTSTKSHSYESHNIPEGITVPEDATLKTHDDKGNKFQHYKLNPAWDKDSEYTPREKRPEWNIIGLLGQVKILKGQPVGDRWIKMRDISETVEEWFIR